MMEKTLSKFILACALLAMPSVAGAQKRVEGSVSADIVTQYIWRGQDLGGFSFQPTASLSWQGLSLNVFGSTGLDKKDPREIDLTLGFQRWGVNIGVTDYWMSGVEKDNRYLYFDEFEGAHKLEANIGYTCKYFSLQAYTFFWGNDVKINGERAYSTYIELTVPFKLGGVDWQVRGGMTPFESAGWTEPKGDDGIAAMLTNSYYDYAEGVACLEASVRATKTMDIGFSKLPVFAELNVNPYLQTANVIFGVTVNPFGK